MFRCPNRQKNVDAAGFEPANPLLGICDTVSIGYVLGVYFRDTSICRYFPAVRGRKKMLPTTTLFLMNKETFQNRSLNLLFDLDNYRDSLNILNYPVNPLLSDLTSILFSNLYFDLLTLLAILQHVAKKC